MPADIVYSMALSATGNVDNVTPANFISFDANTREVSWVWLTEVKHNAVYNVVITGTLTTNNGATTAT